MSERPPQIDIMVLAGPTPVPTHFRAASPRRRHIIPRRLPRKLVLINLLDVACVSVAMFVNSPLMQQPPYGALLWPLIPLIVNRFIETICFLMGYALPVSSLMQMPLALLAMGLYIKMTQCTAQPPPQLLSPSEIGVSNAGGGLHPFCSAPIVISAILVVVEVVIFLLVLFITQAHREYEIAFLAQQIINTDIEMGRAVAHGGQPMQPMPPPVVKRYWTVVQPCGQSIMVAVPDESPQPSTAAAALPPPACNPLERQSAPALLLTPRTAAAGPPGAAAAAAAAASMLPLTPINLAASRSPPPGCAAPTAAASSREEAEEAGDGTASVSGDVTAPAEPINPAAAAASTSGEAARAAGGARAVASSSGEAAAPAFSAGPGYPAVVNIHVDATVRAMARLTIKCDKAQSTGAAERASMSAPHEGPSQAVSSDAGHLTPGSMAWDSTRVNVQPMEDKACPAGGDPASRLDADRNSAAGSPQQS